MNSRNGVEVTAVILGATTEPEMHYRDDDERREGAEHSFVSYCCLWIDFD